MTSAAPRAPERLPAPHVIFRSNAIGRTLTEQAREKYPQYTGILNINPDGNLFCDSLNTGRELDLNDRVYFRRAVTLYDAIALQPAFGRLTGIAVLQIAYPVRSATGQLRSVLLASLNLAQFTQTQPVKAPLPGLEIVLVNDAGLVLSSAGEQRAGPVAARGWYAARVPGVWFLAEMGIRRHLVTIADTVKRLGSNERDRIRQWRGLWAALVDPAQLESTLAEPVPAARDRRADRARAGAGRTRGRGRQ